MGNIITKIEVQKKNKDRVNIYVDEEFKFACNSELIYTHRIEKGKYVDVDYLNEIIEEDNYIKGKNRALKYLERSYKTEKQVYDYLLSKEFNEKAIARIMGFLSSYSFVDDNRYAKLYIEERIKREGKNKIKHDLIKKGISEKIIQKMLILEDKEIEKEVVIKLAEKKYNILINQIKNKSLNIRNNGIERAKLLKKLRDFLMRKGYDFELINETLNKVTVDLDKDLKVDENYFMEDENDSIDELRKIAEKRYEILVRSEKNTLKIKKKLHDFLLRRGYKYNEIKKVINELMNGDNI